MAKKIASGAVVALKEALTNLYWYKSDLRSFLTSTLSTPGIVGELNWDDYKRNVVSTLVDAMVKRQDQYQGDLVRLMAEVARVDDFSHLERLEGGKGKAAAARASVAALRKLAQGHDALLDEQRKVEERRREAHQQLLHKTAVREGLETLNREFMSLLTDPNHQQRGYRLEKVLSTAFDLFDLDPRASFKIVGEQIDGAFTFRAPITCLKVSGSSKQWARPS